jgi:hypothetical protein
MVACPGHLPCTMQLLVTHCVRLYDMMVFLSQGQASQITYSSGTMTVIPHVVSHETSQSGWCH